MVIKLRVREVAATQGVNARVLADNANISYNTALGLMRGVITRIDLDVLDKVCAVLNVQPGDLLQRVTDETA